MEINNEQQYINGVNYAYVLAKHQPQLLDNLLKSESRNDYFIGLQDGKRLYEQERSKSRSVSYTHLTLPTTPYV